MWWAVQLRCIDIHVYIAWMLSYLASHNRGHLEQVYHSFAYLKCYERSKIVYDPEMCDWVLHSVVPTC